MSFFEQAAPAILQLRKMTGLGFSEAYRAIREVPENSDPAVWAQTALDQLGVDTTLKVGSQVKTVKPEVVSTDWSSKAVIQGRVGRWGQNGEIVNYSNSHGLCYEVKFVDDCTAWFEPRELLRQAAT